MSVSHDIVIVRKNGATAVSRTLTVEAGQAIRIDEDVPIGASDLPFTLAFPYAKLKYIWILSDQNLELEFTNAAAGTPTINTVAGKPFVWEQTYNTNLPNPFANTNVTALYVTNGSGAITNLKIDGIVDPT